MSDEGKLGVHITCEHGGNEVPLAYQSCFESPGAAADLRSHRGFDPGAIQAAGIMATRLGCATTSSTTSRLLVDLNRSLTHPNLFSNYSRNLALPRRERVLKEHYHPFRDRVTRRIRELLDRRRTVLHLSVHTFTPRYRGSWRPLDVGLLFDPRRLLESRICEAWSQRLQDELPRLRVAFNQPYLGTDDGFTTALRRQFPGDHYCGCEIEINHRIF